MFKVVNSEFGLLDTPALAYQCDGLRVNLAPFRCWIVALAYQIKDRKIVPLGHVLHFFPTKMFQWCCFWKKAGGRNPIVLSIYQGFGCISIFKPMTRSTSKILKILEMSLRRKLPASEKTQLLVGRLLDIASWSNI